MAAGRCLADRLYDGQAHARLDYENIPTVVFSHPPAGSVGLRKEDAVSQHEKVTVYETAFTPMRYALIALLGNWIPAIHAGMTTSYATLEFKSFSQLLTNMYFFLPTGGKSGPWVANAVDNTNLSPIVG